MNLKQTLFNINLHHKNKIIIALGVIIVIATFGSLNIISNNMSDSKSQISNLNGKIIDLETELSDLKDGINNNNNKLSEINNDVSSLSELNSDLDSINN